MVGERGEDGSCFDPAAAPATPVLGFWCCAGAACSFFAACSIDIMMMAWCSRLSAKRKKGCCCRGRVGAVFCSPPAPGRAAAQPAFWAREAPGRLPAHAPTEEAAGWRAHQRAGGVHALLQRAQHAPAQALRPCFAGARYQADQASKRAPWLVRPACFFLFLLPARCRLLLTLLLPGCFIFLLCALLHEVLCWKCFFFLPTPPRGLAADMHAPAGRGRGI